MRKQKRNEVIMVVDDAPDTLEVLHRSIEHMGFTVFSCESAAEAIDRLKTNQVDLVITDYHMPFIGGLDLIKHIREHYPYTEVMMITGYASVEGAVEAIKAGAEEYLAKPFTDDELEQAIERALEKLSIRADKKGTPAKDISKKFGLIAESEEMKKVSELIIRASGSDLPMLLAGEPGTGKELAARIIHYESSRSIYPFVYINCKDIPESILENEIFGYVKPESEAEDHGKIISFPEKAIQPGFLELAGRGTVYLDEISKTSLAVQVKLLDALTKNEITAVGDTKPRSINCRIIAATTKDLITLAGKGFFREDLFFRLNVINISLPPLRARKSDILPLCRELLARAYRELGRSTAPIFSEEGLRSLELYEWPGNLTELISLMNNLAEKIEGETVAVFDLPRCLQNSMGADSKARLSLQQVEVEHIRNVLQNCGGNKTKAAQVLGIDRKTLRDKLERQND
jgi:two-component system, NtrC family, response regulator HydG